MSLVMKNQGRQAADVAKVAFDYTDLPSTDFVPAVELPSDAIVLGVSLGVDTVFGAAETIAVGVEGAATTFLGATAADATGITRAPDANLGDNAPIGDTMVIGLTGSAAMTLGSGTLIVEYIRAFRETHTHG